MNLGRLSGTDDVLQQRGGTVDVILACGDVQCGRRTLRTAAGTCPPRHGQSASSHVTLAVDHLAAAAASAGVHQLCDHSVVTLLHGDRQRREPVLRSPPCTRRFSAAPASFVVRTMLLNDEPG